MSSLDEYIEKLGCPDEAERTYAAEDIGYLNTPDGVPASAGTIGKETSRAVRDAIFQALIRIDADAAIEGSILLFDSEDPTDSQPGSRCAAPQRRPVDPFSERGHARGRQGQKETRP